MLKNLMEDFKVLFPNYLLGLLPNKGVQVSIRLVEGPEPIRWPLFQYSPTKRKEIEEQVNYLLKRVLITEGSSPFSALVIFVPKPNGTLWMCINCKGLNKLTRKNS